MSADRRRPGLRAAGYGALLAGGLVLTAAALRVIGVQRSVRLFWRLADLFPASGPLASSRAIALGSRIAAVADAIPRGPKCLPRSLLLGTMMRRHRMAGELCVGVAAAGAFDAHAWVELAGRPVNDRADIAQDYRLVYRFPTGAA